VFRDVARFVEWEPIVLGRVATPGFVKILFGVVRRRSQMAHNQFADMTDVSQDGYEGICV
jgi:hypothetical protein